MNRSYKRWLAASMATVMSVSSAYVAELATSITALAGYGQDKINLADEATRKCFQEISSALKEIAAGRRSSTAVTVNFDTE